MKNYYFLILIFFALASCKDDVNNTHQSEKYAADLFLPDDLKVELWAESPMLYNPTNMDTDHKGRIWITEGTNYRNFTNDSTFYKMKEGDRIVILQDTDGNGQADSTKVYVQDKDLVAPLGIAVIGNQVIVSCSPYLIRYTDHNADDVPDQKEILLKGFGGHDHDHSLHSVVGGPDGKYYFNVGNAGPHLVTDKSGWTLRSGSVYTGGSPHNLKNQGNQVSDDHHVWVGGLQMSMNEDATGLKVLGHNFRNSYETYIDGEGNMWQNDNDDQVASCRVSWLMEGGNTGFFSNDGTRYWSADQRPGQSMPTAHWHMDDPGLMPPGDISGAGSPTGITLLEGDELGGQYRGMVLSEDAGRNQIFSYKPQMKNSGYNLENLRKIFLSSSKIDDVGYQWNNKHFDSDKSKWFRPSDLVVGTDGALYVADWFDAVVGGHQVKDKEAHGRIYRVSPKNKKLSTPNISFNTVQALMAAFKNPAVNVRFYAAKLIAQAGEKYYSELSPLISDKNPYTRARAIWLLARMGSKGKSQLYDLLNSKTDADQITAFKALRSILTPEEYLTIAAKAVMSNNTFLKREAAVGLEKIPYDKKKTILLDYIKNTPIDDPYYVNTLTTASYGDEAILFDDIKQNIKDTAIVNRYALLIHTPNTLETILKIIHNSREFELINKAITSLAFIYTKPAVQAMMQLRAADDARVKEVAEYWIAFRSSNDWSKLYDWSKLDFNVKEKRKLVAMLALKELVTNLNISAEDRAWTIEEMANEPLGAKLILDMVKANTLPKDIYDVAIKKMIQSKDPIVSMQAKTLYENSDQAAYQQKEILVPQSNLEKGKDVFKSYCALCHKHRDMGNSIGPDLSDIHKKLDKIGLYEAIVNPSSSIVFGYESWIIHTKDGNVYTGFLIGEDNTRLTLKDLAGKNHIIPIQNIATRTKDSKSIMPSAKAYKMPKEDLSILIAWLEKGGK